MRNMTSLFKNTLFSIKSHLFNESQGKRQIYSMFKFKKENIECTKASLQGVDQNTNKGLPVSEREEKLSSDLLILKPVYLKRNNMAIYQVIHDVVGIYNYIL